MASMTAPGEKMRQATIRDVARHANVSVASVSRTLNGHSNVHPDTRDRVLESVKELGYVPNAAARSLSMALSHTIGVVVPDLHGEFFSELIRGMDKAGGEAGYQLLLSTMHADIGLAGQALRSMRGRVDGLIVMAPQIDPDELDTLLPPGLPVVLLISAEGRGRPLIGIDNRSGAADMARHLVSLGRHKLVHIMGPENNIDAMQRRGGFEQAVRKAAPEATIRICNGDFTERAGVAAVSELVEQGEQFDAIFAANDMMALGAIQELRRRGIDVPGDVAVGGFDDIPLAHYLGLTTMEVHMAEIGEEAVRRLVAQLDQKSDVKANTLLLAPELIVRASSVATA